MNYDFLADLVVAFHFAYVAFILLGQLAILVGFGLGWRWVRNFWFRIVHLIAMGIVGIEAILAIDCPLTVWEARLRELAGHPAEEGSFVGRLLHYVIFYDVDSSVLEWIHIAVALLVIATIVLIPPRWPWRRSPRPPQATLPDSHAASDTATHER
jgi:hypothetical protein